MMSPMLTTNAPGTGSAGIQDPSLASTKLKVSAKPRRVKAVPTLKGTREIVCQEEGEAPVVGMSTTGYALGGVERLWERGIANHPQDPVVVLLQLGKYLLLSQSIAHNAHKGFADDFPEALLGRSSWTTRLTYIFSEYSNMVCLKPGTSSSAGQS